MKIFEKSKHPFFIRGILNKLGRIEFTLYLYEQRLKIDDLKWYLEDRRDESIRRDIEREFKEKVKRTFFDRYIIHDEYNNNKNNKNESFI